MDIVSPVWRFLTSSKFDRAYPCFRFTILVLTVWVEFSSCIDWNTSWCLFFLLMSTVRVLEYLLVLLEDLSSPMELSAELALLAEELDMAAVTWLRRLVVRETGGETDWVVRLELECL